MNLPQLQLSHEFIPLPESLFSSDSHKPFHECLICNRYLLMEGTQYLIEKAFRGLEIVFEYAICTRCFSEVAAGFSEDSRQKVDEYYADRVDLVGRRRFLMQRYPLNLEEWISQCLVTGLPRQTYTEYNVVVECDGNNLLFAYSPFLISGDALEEIYDLLSEHTRAELGGFMEHYLGLPPEAVENTPPRFLVS